MACRSVASRMRSRTYASTGAALEIVVPGSDTDQGSEAVMTEEKPVLSDREIEVLGLVGQGLTNVRISRELFISEATVKSHLLRTYRKLGVSDRTAAVVTAMEHGLLP